MQNGKASPRQFQSLYQNDRIQPTVSDFVSLRSYFRRELRAERLIVSTPSSSVVRGGCDIIPLAESLPAVHENQMKGS